MSLPASYTARPVEMDDLDAIYHLFLACSIVEHGSLDFSRQELLSWWQDEGFDLATNSQAIFTSDGSIVGYVDVSHDPDGHLGFTGRTRPDHSGRGIGGYLVIWAQQRAEAFVASTLDHADATLSQWVPVVNSAARELLYSVGYQPVRRFWRMRIDLREPPEPPAWPHGVASRAFVPGRDETATHQAVQDAFHDHWRHEFVPFDRWMRREIQREDFDPSLWFLAAEGEEIVGAAHCRMNGEMGWVDELGVRPRWRRQGIARALLRAVFAEFYQRGVRAVGLGVDAESATGAPQLYTRAGMRMYREWDIFEKPLRANREGS